MNKWRGRKAMIINPGYWRRCLDAHVYTQTYMHTPDYPPCACVSSHVCPLCFQGDSAVAGDYAVAEPLQTRPLVALPALRTASRPSTGPHVFKRSSFSCSLVPRWKAKRAANFQTSTGGRKGGWVWEGDGKDEKKGNERAGRVSKSGGRRMRQINIDVIIPS